MVCNDDYKNFSDNIKTVGETDPRDALFWNNEKIVRSILRVSQQQPYLIQGLVNYFRRAHALELSYSKVYRLVKKLEEEGKLARAAGELDLTTSAGRSFLLDNGDSESSTISNRRTLGDHYLRDLNSTAENSDGERGNAGASKFSAGGGFEKVEGKKNWLIRKMEEIVGSHKILDYNDETGKIKRWDLNYLFTEYCFDTADKRIILKKKDLSSNPDLPPYKILPYNTRFTSDAELSRKVDDFNARWDYFSEKHESAVFLTLTTDMNNFENLQEATDSLFKNFKKFMDYLNRRYKRVTGEKLDYLFAFEFAPQKALPHIHAIIFGTDYLDLRDYRKNAANWTEEETTKTVKRISKMWGEKYGQGRIVYIYGIRKKKGDQKKIEEVVKNSNSMYNDYKRSKNNNSEQKPKTQQIWVFKDARKKPRDCKDNDVAKYLRKYLIKMLFTMREVMSKVRGASRESFVYKKDARKEIYKKLGTIPLYLATNKRFFSSSAIPKDLNINEEGLARAQELKEEYGNNSIYEPMMSCYEVGIPAFVYEAIFNYKNETRSRGGFGSMGLSNYSIDRGGW